MTWKIQLFGGLAVCGRERVVSRFRGQKAAELLAFLAFHSGPSSNPHMREALIGMLWPDAESATAKHYLSVELTSLRHLLEPPGVPPGSVLVTDRFSVRLHGGAVTTDVFQFEQALKRSERSDVDGEEAARLKREALDLYRGALLPGYYSEWIGPQSVRLSGLYMQTVQSLVAQLPAEQALPICERAVSADPNSEDAIRLLMSVYASLDRVGDAVKAYRQFARHLTKAWGEAPSEALQKYAKKISRQEISTSEVGSTTIVRENPPRSDAKPVASANSVLFQEAFSLVSLTRFFGREEDMQALSRLITERSRLITVTGPGGIGKTRIALETVCRVAAESSVSAVFVPLAEAHEASRVPDEILRRLGQIPGSDSDVLEQCAEALRSLEEPILVLDNYEQLAETGATIVAKLLVAVPQLRVVATSRQLLRIHGEREFALGPLPLGADEKTVQDVAALTSVQLFVDRAQAARPDFQITAHNAETIASLGRLLEGIPLAIELAAARAQLLAPSTILEQLSASRLDFLASRRRDVHPRHRTLRTMLAWSFDLLSEEARLALEELSVFRGGWDLASAESICDGDVLGNLAELRDNSLITLGESEAGARFSLFETVREFASERLSTSGRASTVSKRHLDHFAGVVADAFGSGASAPSADAHERIDVDLDNVRAALEHSLTSIGEPAGLRMVGALWRYWMPRGYAAEGAVWIDRILQATDPSLFTLERAQALNAAGILAWSQGRHDEAKGFYGASLALREQLNDKEGVVSCLHNLGSTAETLGELDFAHSYFARALTLSREIKARKREGYALTGLGIVALGRCEFELARATFEEALTIHRQMQDGSWQQQTLTELGKIAALVGDYDSADRFLQEALGLAHDRGDRIAEAVVRSEQGEADRIAGRLVEAATGLRKSLAISRELKYRVLETENLVKLGHLALDRGTVEEASECLLEAARTFDLNPGGAFDGQCRLGLAMVAFRGGDVARGHEQAGAALRLFEAAQSKKGCIEVLELVGEQYWLAARSEASVRLLAATDAHRRHLRCPLTGPRLESIKRVREMAQNLLGGPIFSQLWDSGQAMSLSLAVQAAEL